MRILTVISTKALAWVNENCHFERWQWQGLPGSQIACDWRCAEKIAEEMVYDGLKFGTDFTV